MGLTACISASLLQAVTTNNKMWPSIGPLNIFVVILIAMLIGGLFGAFNGFFVAKFKLHPFIVTLGTQLIVYTLLLLYVKTVSYTHRDVYKRQVAFSASTQMILDFHFPPNTSSPYSSGQRISFGVLG